MFPFAGAFDGALTFERLVKPRTQGIRPTSQAELVPPSLALPARLLAPPSPVGPDPPIVLGSLSQPASTNARPASEAE